MSPQFLAQLRARFEEVHPCWQTLLRAEPVSGPLANPEALQYYIPEAWNEILNAAAKPHSPISLRTARAQLPACKCGHNPYRTFFLTAEQAVTEAAVLVQAAQAPAERAPADLAELIFAVRALARTNIDTFCGACVHRMTANNCRFVRARR